MQAVLAVEEFFDVVGEGEGAAVEIGVVVARADAKAVPSCGVKVADGVVLVRGEAEESVS